MTITLDTPITGDDDLTANEAIAVVLEDAPNPVRINDIAPCLTELHLLCRAYRLVYRIMVGQQVHETGWYGPAGRWDELNPAGLGITTASDPTPYRIETGQEAARLHVWSMLVALRRWGGADGLGVPAGAEGWRERWTAKYRDPMCPTVRVVDDLNQIYAGNRATWMTDPNGPAKIVAVANALFPGIPENTEEEPTMTKPSILVVAGHRSTDRTGNPEETRLTPALARDYRAAFRAAGYDCWWLQAEVDGDWDPDDTAGNLDTVGRKTASWMASQPGPLLMLDLHYEGSPAPGCFAIVPDVTGLRTGVAIWQDPADTWANNTLDRRLGAAWAKQMQLHTGLRLRTGIRQPGLMDESETGVGGQGWRLAMFAYTVAHRARAVRLVLEHGNHTHAEDRAIIFRDDFTNRCAPAAVAAVAEVYGGVVTEPETPEAPAVDYPEGMDLGIVREIWPRFAETGDVSRLWLAVGRTRGWAPPDPTFFGQRFDTRTYWRFVNGLLVWRPNDEADVRVME